MKILIACDHAGYNLKQQLIAFLQQKNYLVNDLGCNSADISVDYPDFAHNLAINLQDGDFGILICGSGVGISIAANRHHNVKAALCTNVKTAKLARAHNNANVLCLGARFIKKNTAINMLKSFLQQDFEGGRHITRVSKINNYENK
jgi:ribose 5-phosphate isomerase B